MESRENGRGGRGRGKPQQGRGRGGRHSHTGGGQRGRINNAAGGTGQQLFGDDKEFPALTDANYTQNRRKGTQHSVFNPNRNRNPGFRTNLSDNANYEKYPDDQVSKKPKKKENAFEGPVFGFKKLHKFLSLNPDEVVLSINKDKEDWVKFLESDDFNSEKLILTVQVIGQVVCADIPVLKQQQINVITEVCSSKNFLSRIVQLISSSISPGFSASSQRRRNAQLEFEVDTSPMKIMGNIYQLCDFVVKTMPHLAMDSLSSLITLSLGALYGNPYNNSTELMDKFKSLLDQIKEFEVKKKEKEETEKRRRKLGFNDLDLAEFDQETPPDDFRLLEVIPSSEELLRCHETFLRPNKKTGAYVDSNHYLDVQFRLLREDFVRPLREGIQKFLKDSAKYIATGRMPMGEVRLYTEVSIAQVVKERDSIVYKIQLSERSYKKIKWDKSKRLLPGSLLVLTSAEGKPFQSPAYFGVVFNRNLPELQKGILTVTWEGAAPVYGDGEEYLMFESEVYLEAYRHTLEALKTIELDNYSMKKFIVDACSSVEAPKYLREASNQLKLQLITGEQRYIAPLDDSQWPEAAEFGLDSNQYDAFKAALTNEFSIIQGPPGTGKTFLGLKVAQVLLSNSELWKGTVGSVEANPITVVCYTNHALDQFLKGILKYFESEGLLPEIIRIGGRCKSDALLDFNLREVRHRNRRKLPKHYWAMEYDARDRVIELENERANEMSEVTGLLHLQGIIDFEQLSKWSQIQLLYPSRLWECFRSLTWFGIDRDKLNKSNLYDQQVAAFIGEIFQVREFPKTQKSTTRPPLQAPVQQNEEEDDDENDEDYDLDELLENRLVDDILLESETSQKSNNTGRYLSYLPNCSLRSCEKAIQHKRKEMERAIKNMSEIQSSIYLSSHDEELVELENRLKILSQIFRLYSESLLDLPDVSELLEDIKENRILHYYASIPMSHRWALYFEVVNRTRLFLASNVAEIERNLMAAQKAQKDIVQYGDGLILKDCKVIGLTTTGAAKYNGLLKMIGSKIVIVEEAAEVFEAHIVTCVTQKTEQLILIGDHRQLRPSPTVYDLATKYNLDLSLFERMINNNLHCYSLKMQHRMRPEIADLVVGSIYNELLNHDSVKLYPDVKGVTKNVYFLTHTEKETAGTDSCSKSNKHEAKFLSGLCRYLVLQDYKPEQITVLTMYTGQMFLLKKEISETCQGVRIECVDNFQGEENDIILLSLVRSNSEGKIGFLNIDNRICVSLSRAKHGLYVIGNMKAMAQKSKTWRVILGKLGTADSLGDFLELECQIHGTRTQVRSKKDFRKVPEGGCDKLCETELPCTHVCQRVCHILDRHHKAYKCQLPCLKFCATNPDCPHPCKGKCYEKCPPCKIKIEKELNCELKHKQVLPCHRKVDDIICSEPVEKTLPCSHKETLACHISIFDYKCKLKVTRDLPCGHSREMACHVDPTSVRCKEQTLKILQCNHSQTEECWIAPESVKCQAIVSKTFPKCGHKIDVKCCDLNKPQPCRSKCSTRLACGHACVKLCHAEDNPEHFGYECKKECTRECEYGHKCKTKHPCFKPCPPCTEAIERILPYCGHQTILECYIDPARHDCLEECQRTLPDPHCGHKCQNLCYQPCGPCTILVKKRASCGHEQEVPCSLPALPEDCLQLVIPTNIPSCGHRDGLVPCKFSNLPSEEVTKYCTHKCNYEFKKSAGGCGHFCKGNCSSCSQGRIHVKCGKECGKQLVCGHVCAVPCSNVCPPCKKPCLMKCEHSVCKMNCGDPCSECKEKCTWACAHIRCTKLCGEICDRDPCNEPCPMKLKCGHSCVGYCGEPCPPLCRECNKADLTEVFFGNEDDENARFVYLEDCGDVIEEEGLENWLKCSQGSQIVAKACPKCKTPIRNCRRFANIIRQHYIDVMTIKMKSFGNKANSDRLRDQWIGAINNDDIMERVFPLTHAQIKAFLVNETPGQFGGMMMIPKTIDEFSMRSMDFIADSTRKAANDLMNLKQTKALIPPHYEKVVAIYRKTLSSMLERQPLSKQEIRDFNAELDRLDFGKQLMIRRCLPSCNPQNLRAYPTYVEAKKLIDSPLLFTSDRKETFKRILKELDDLLKSGLGITDRERKEILQAMGMSQGHWFKCPNGHVYIITECGGAMQESRCNECGASIGGGSHRLRSDNQLATEMDGASHSAWPGGPGN